MQANDFCCEVCGDGSTTLNVHHKEYFKGYEPWEYEIGQLSVLCELCHEATHNEFDILKLVCSYAKLDGPKNRTELAFLLAGYMGIDYEGVLSLSGLSDHRAYKFPYLCGERSVKLSNKLIVDDYKKSTEHEDEKNHAST